MKIIKYNRCIRIDNGTEKNPKIEETFIPVEIECRTQASYDANYPVAESEAVPGTIEVIGEFEQDQPTQLDMIEAQVVYTAMMTDTLLEV